MTGRARSSAARAARATVNRRTAPAWVAGGVIAAFLTSVIALGGLETGEATPTPLAAGEEVRLSLYAATVLDAHFTDEIEEKFLVAEPGEKLIVVTLQLENLSERPIGVGNAADKVESHLISVEDPLLSLPGATADDGVQAWRGDGSAGPVILQPGVPSEVTLAWTAPDDAFADGSVYLDVYDAVEARGQVLLSEDHVRWQRGELAARITVNAEEGR